MKRILFVFFLACIPLISLSSETVWSAIMAKSKGFKKELFWLEGNYFYQIQSELTESCVKKIDRVNLKTLDSVFIELKWDGVQHDIMKSFEFDSQLWLLTKTHDQLKEIASTWIHSLDIETLKISKPTKVADYNLPYNKSGSYVNLEDRSEKLFSSNLMGLETSFLEGYCMSMASKDLVRVYSSENAEKQMDRPIETTLYKNSFDNKFVAEFRAPSPNFYIYKKIIDLDGSVYILGQTISQNREKSKGIPYIQQFDDLQIIKYNPVSGNYIGEIIEDDFPNFYDYDMKVDGDVIITGRTFDALKSENSIVGAKYSNQLIKTATYSYTLDESLGDTLNLPTEIQYYNFYYKKSFHQDAEKIPLLNCDLVYSESLDNGDLIFIFEKRTSVAYRNGMRDLFGSLVIISLNKQWEHNWTKIVQKDQRSSLITQLGVYVYSDGKNLHLWYNESDRLQKIAANPNTITGNEQINKFRRIRYLQIDNKGNIIVNDKIELGGKGPLLLERSTCSEIEPGVVLLKAGNAKYKVFGRFEPS